MTTAGNSLAMSPPASLRRFPAEPESDAATLIAAPERRVKS
jgi:hypothetical protein